jgi:hypothetical protein
VKPLRHRTVIALIIGAVGLAALAGVGLYGLVGTTTDTPAASTPTTPALANPAPTKVAPPTSLPHTNDPVTYAKAVARSLFVWDTASGQQPEDYQSVISEDADPSSVETSGLVNDLAAYFPTDTQWQQLRHYKTVETVTIVRAYIPAAWGQAVASDPSAVRPGTTAVTIDAFRHRTGSWYEQSAATSDPVSFTVFLACQPTFPRCHILRLSGPNTPLK